MSAVVNVSADPGARPGPVSAPGRNQPVSGALPNLIIAGVGKAGTTSLFRYLAQHPAICASAVKETDYFSPLRFDDPGPLEPLSRYASTVAHHRAEPYRMEASPAYAYGGRPVIAAIRSHCPDAKVILLLRDPVSRLWSNYTYLRSRALLHGDWSFERFVAACQRLRRDGRDRRQAARFLRAVSISHYEEYVPAWLDAFGDHARVVFFEQLTERPADQVAGLCRWLGIDPEAAACLRYGRHNRTVAFGGAWRGRLIYALNAVADRLRVPAPGVAGVLDAVVARAGGGPRLAQSTRVALREHFAPGVARLVADLRRRGYRDLPEWCDVGPR